MAKVDLKLIALWEATKEPLRLIALGLVSYLLVSVIPQLDARWAIVLTGILRYVDSVLHEFGKVEKNETLAGGLTRF